MTIPFSFADPIVSGRVVLRLLTPADTDAVHAWMSDPEVVRYQLYEPRDRATVAEKVAEYALASRLEKVDDYVQPAIVVDDVVVGAIYFTLPSVEDLTAKLDPRNAASVSLCQRLGMRHEAHFVENMMFKGDWADTGIYAILAREWNARAGT